MTFSDLLDLAMSDVDGGLSLDRDVTLAEALRRIWPPPDEELSSEPEPPTFATEERFN